jgi:hypothetical protein
MCERYTLTDAGRYNIARGQMAPVRTAEGEQALRWGLMAPWRGHGGKRGSMMFEAPPDAIAATPILRTARVKRRCLMRYARPAHDCARPPAISARRCTATSRRPRARPRTCSGLSWLRPRASG